MLRNRKVKFAGIAILVLLCGFLFGATITEDWPASLTQIEGTADGYSTLSGTTEEYSSIVNMDTSGNTGAIVYVEVNYDSTPTDQVTISLYRHRTNSTDTRDTTAVWAMQGDKSVDPQRISFTVTDCHYFSVGVKQSGSTDTHDVRTYWEGKTGASN